MASIIQNKIEHALGDGARSAKFDCMIMFPDAYQDDVAVSTLVKTSSYPGKNHETIDFKFKGRSIPLKGQTKYTQTWDCTFYLTEDHKVKQQFEQWIEALDQKHNYSNIPAQDRFDVNDTAVEDMQSLLSKEGYTTTMTIQQLNFDLDNKPIAYKLYNVFPIAVSAIDVSAESVGTLLEYTVTFSYTHYDSKINSDLNKNAVDSFIDGALGMAKDAISGFVDSAKETIGGLFDDGISAIGGGLSDLFSGSSDDTGEAKADKITSKEAGKDGGDKGSTKLK